MSRNVVLLLVLGVVVFAVAFSPLGLTSFRIPSSTFSTTTVDGIRIVYDVTVRPDVAKDAPVVVLLHGFSGNRVMMRMISLTLADKGFICASVDLRGFGSSDGLMGSLEDFDKDVKAVVGSMQAMGLGDTSRLVLIATVWAEAFASNWVLN